jgi:hypothetical protein
MSLFLIVAAHCRRLCSNNGEADDRHEVHRLQYLLQAHFSYLDRDGLCHFVVIALFGVSGKIFKAGQIDDLSTRE